MVTAFYILLFLAIWHFLYESVIAPSVRHGLRYKFFEIRDELRRIKIKGIKDKDDQLIYEHLDNSICNLINSMSFISIGNYIKLKRSFDDKEISEVLLKKKKMIYDSNNKDLKRIDKRMSELGGKALIINNGALILYLSFPLFIVLIIGFFSHQIEKWYKKLIKISSRLIYTSDNYDNPNHLEVV